MIALSKALRVGVTGHRIPPKLPTHAVGPVRQTVAAILATLSKHPVTIVSAMAEGADQIVADEGLKHGADLTVILPFETDEYKRDFSLPGSETLFDHIMNGAHHIENLGFSRKDEIAEYEAVGAAVLAQSDVIIAIWDEAKAAGRGGTGHIVNDAIAMKKPVALINPNAPHNFRWLPTGTPGDTPQFVQAALQRG